MIYPYDMQFLSIFSCIEKSFNLIDAKKTNSGESLKKT